MRKILIFMVGVLFLGALSIHPIWAEENAGKGQHDLAEMLEHTKVSLEQGLQASLPQGKPISSKFEMEDGKLQLSVYTMKDGKFSEVVIDHKTGKVAKSEAITSGDDLTAATAQSEAMSKAKSSLKAAVHKAVAANKGFMAISVFPSLKDGHPVAEVTLTDDEEENTKTVFEKLD